MHERDDFLQILDLGLLGPSKRQYDGRHSWRFD